MLRKRFRSALQFLLQTFKLNQELLIFVLEHLVFLHPLSELELQGVSVFGDEEKLVFEAFDLFVFFFFHGLPFFLCVG